MNTMQIPEKILPINIVDGSQPTECFPVVGIGASAGGLDAFRQLLSRLPIDTGMAFVLIQHLEPNQKSLLSEILARETTMPVVEVQQGGGTQLYLCNSTQHQNGDFTGFVTPNSSG
jgi:chemotaxis response regulator CheB